MATQNNLAKRSVSISALVEDPLAAVTQGAGFAVVVLNDALLKNMSLYFIVCLRKLTRR